MSTDALRPRESDGDEVVRIEDVTRAYVVGNVTVNALRGISFTIATGEFVSVMGPSGGGKSSLLNILGCLDSPSSGRYLLDGEDVATLGERELARRRRDRIGIVFQSFNLLAKTSAIENVELPLIYARVGSSQRRVRALAALEKVGLDGRERHYPTQLSGGEQQRVAIARALVAEPTILLADEPTGNLDSTSSGEVMAIFRELNESGVTIVLVTHEPEIARYGHRLIRIRDGRIESDEAVHGSATKTGVGS